MSAWRAALRIARRDARRHWRRSLLIVVLILAPVAAATGMDILFRTATSTQAEQERQYGGADARVSLDYSDGEPTMPTLDQVAAELPDGSRVIPGPRVTYGAFRTPGHLAQASVVLTDHLGDPLIRAEVQLVSGRSPQASDEVAISRDLADQLGVPGDARGERMALYNGPELTVTGMVRDPFCLSCSVVAATSDSDLAEELAATEQLKTYGAPYLVDLPPDAEAAPLGEPGPPSPAALDRLGDLPIYLDLRDSWGSGYSYGLDSLTRASEQELKSAAVVTLIAGLGLLEVVLLAGTAFAVGARRQTRDLGLVAAQGGSPRDLRRVVLAQGLLLGLLGTLGGVAIGFAAMIAGRPVWERLADEIRVGLHVGTIELTVIIAVGILSGLAAALVPALVASRRRTVDVLATRSAPPTSRSRWAPVAGVTLIVAGVGLALLAAHEMGRGPSWVTYSLGDGTSMSGPAGLVPPAGGYQQRPGSTDGALVVLVGVFGVVAGILLAAPALLAGLARASGRLPVTTRMATRDAARHRHRTGPAAAAIAVAVGGSVAISCLIASDRASQPPEIPSLPERVLAVSSFLSPEPDGLEPAVEAARAALPGSRALDVHIVWSGEVPEPEIRSGPTAALVDEESATPLEVDLPEACVREACARSLGGEVGVGTPELVGLAAGRGTDQGVVADALDDGKAIVFDADLVDTDGKVALRPSPYADGEERREAIRLPALVLPRADRYSALPEAYVNRAAIEENGWDTQSRSALIDYPAAAAPRVDGAIAAAEALGAYVETAEPPRDWTRVVRIGISAAAVLVGLLGVAMVTALSAAEARPDLATLSAVGAPPGRRRRLAVAQALVLAGLGTVLGMGFGFFFARAARPAVGAVDTIVPWGDLLLTVAAVPLLAALIGLLGTLGRVPLTRRAD